MTELDKLYATRRAREYYYRKMQKAGKIVKPYKTYTALPVPYKRKFRVSATEEEMDRKAKEWLEK